MRKRSSYRPKPVISDPLAYVLESVRPLAQHDSYLIDLHIKNHGALAALTQGRATIDDVNTLISMVNVTEALYRMGFGSEYGDVLKGGLDALTAIGRRGVDSGKYILRSSEMAALNLVTELHDAQTEVVTVGDVERAIKLVHREFFNKRMTVIA